MKNGHPSSPSYGLMLLGLGVVVLVCGQIADLAKFTVLGAGFAAAGVVQLLVGRRLRRS